jgi:hypothetical protein
MDWSEQSSTAVFSREEDTLRACPPVSNRWPRRHNHNHCSFAITFFTGVHRSCFDDEHSYDSNISAPVIIVAGSRNPRNL